MDPMAKQNHTKKTPPNLRIAFTKAKVGPPEDIWSSANPLAVQQSWPPGLHGYRSYTSPKLTLCPRKWMVGILVSFWDGLSSGAMLVSGRVSNINTCAVPWVLWFSATPIFPPTPRPILSFISWHPGWLARDLYHYIEPPFQFEWDCISLLWTNGSTCVAFILVDDLEAWVVVVPEQQLTRKCFPYTKATKSIILCLTYQIYTYMTLIWHIIYRTISFHVIWHHIIPAHFNMI